jgi:hypothetical protein
MLVCFVFWKFKFCLSHRVVLKVTHDVTLLTDGIKVTCDDTVTHGDKVTHEKVSHD